MSFVSELFGGPDVDRHALKEFEPLNIQAGGLTTRITDASPSALRNFELGGRSGISGNRTVEVQPSQERQDLVRGIQDVLRSGASDIGDLRGDVRPGFGRLTEARVRGIENNRRRAVGNLRENLSRRRVLGSSFGQDALARAEAEFAQEESEARAQSFLEELDMTTQLIDRETELSSQAFQTGLNELNFQAEVATQLASQGTSAMQQSAAQQAQIASEQAQGIGELVGTGISAMAMSDRRLKTDIKQIDGMLYEFRYIGHEGTYMGPMADEIEAMDPSLVSWIGGYRAINDPSLHSWRVN